jgi:multisubunit Na+/H+ antiporter MnhG subunit
VSAGDLAVDVLLALAVLGEAVCVVGLLLGRAAIDRLHYAGAATTIPPALVGAAVVVNEGATASSINAIVVAGLMLVLGGVVTHATARVVFAHGQRP